MVARWDGAGVRLITRNGHDWTERYPAVASAVGRLPCQSCVIDGEVAIVDEEGRAVFDRLQEVPRTKPEAILFALDLMELDGQDLRREPLLTRKRTLLSLLKAAPHGIVYNEHLDGDGAMIFRHACGSGGFKIAVEHVRSDGARLTLTQIGRQAAPARTGFEGLVPHQSLDPMQTARSSLRQQVSPHPPAAEGAIARQEA